MWEQVFIHEEKTLLLGFLVVLLNWQMDLAVSFWGVSHLLSIFLIESHFVRDHFLEWNCGERNVSIWQDVHTVELVRAGWLLTDWKQLNPGEGLDFSNDISHVLPIDCREWISNVYFQALDLSLLSIILERFLLCHGRLNKLSGAGYGFSFDERIIPVSCVLTLFVFDIGLKQKKFTFHLWIWMGHEDVVFLKFLNSGSLEEFKLAVVGNVIFFLSICCGAALWGH